MMKSKLTIAIAILILSIFLFGFRQEMNLVGTINDARTRYGRCEVVENQALNEFAEARLAKLNSDNYYTFHTDREGFIQDCNNFRKSTVYTGYIGEIVSRSERLSYGHFFVSAWLKSRYHRAVMLEKQYKYVGYAVVVKDGYVFIVVEFMTEET